MKPKRFQFGNMDYRQDPWRVFSEFRNAGAVIPMRFPMMGRIWAATTYDAVNTCLKDTRHFVRNPFNAGRKNFIPMQWMIPRKFLTLADHMLTADNEQHRRLRSLVDKAFARRNVEGMMQRLGTLANEQLDLAEAVLRDEGQVDLIDHFARPFPLTVICELLGLPLEDRAKFRSWFEPFSRIRSVLGIFTLSKGVSKLIKYLNQQFEQVRRQPREGLVSELVHVEEGGDQLSQRELLAMVFLLLVAGHETTVHLISNAVLTLMQKPDVKQELVNDWSLGDPVIDEVLRYCSPLQMAKPRYVSEDMQYFGQPLRRGQLILPILASANYDPERFENPDQFDFRRVRNYHMSFGSGPHVCLGMKLAKSETFHALQSLYQRWPDLTPAFDLNRPDWSPRIGTRGLKSLVVKN